MNASMLPTMFPGKPCKFKMLSRIILPLGVEAAHCASTMYDREIIERHKSVASPPQHDLVDKRGARDNDEPVVVHRHNRTKFALDILSDMFLLSECDMLLGSPGNWMSIVLNMHRAKHPTAAPNHTCLVNSDADEGVPEVDCFGSARFAFMTTGFTEEAVEVPCNDNVLT